MALRRYGAVTAIAGGYSWPRPQAPRAAARGKLNGTPCSRCAGRLDGLVAQYLHDQFAAALDDRIGRWSRVVGVVENATDKRASVANDLVSLAGGAGMVKRDLQLPSRVPACTGTLKIACPSVQARTIPS